MARATSPHCCADLMTFPPEHWPFHSEPSVVAKQPAGTPENAEPAEKTSGYSAARTLVIMAPEEKPLTTMRAGSTLWRCRAQATIDMMPVESPPPSLVSPALVDTSKQWPSRVASGTTMTYPYRSAAVAKSRPLPLKIAP